FEAGTAGFVADVNKAKASVRDFGEQSKGSLAQSTATVRLLEGNLTGSARAVTRFLSDTLKLGPILQKAFPIAGAVYLGDAIIQTGMKVYEFFEKMRTAGERIKGAFAEAALPLKITNAELAVSNERLQQEINKLEG